MNGNLTRTGTGTGTALAPQREIDPFEAYAQSVNQQGNYISFKNNEFTYGQENEILPMGTHLVAHMEGLRRGWRRWADKQITDDLTELVVDMVPLPARNTLGDLDQSLWERDNNGKPRDPWQETSILQLVDENGERYIYPTASKGGRGALGKLSDEYRKLRKQKPGLQPIIELGSRSYDHPEFGKTYVPVFTITGWANIETLEPEGDIPPLEDEQIPFDVEKPAPAPMAAAKAATNKAAAAVANRTPKF